MTTGRATVPPPLAGSQGYPYSVFREDAPRADRQQPTHHGQPVCLAVSILRRHGRTNITKALRHNARDPWVR